MLNSYILTIDTDWAPDCAIDAVSDQLVKRNIKATWFITHDSPAVRRLFGHKGLFEFGLHPNFLPSSTQGASEEEVMSRLLDILPDSKIIRTHVLYQSSRLMRLFADKYGIEVDSSIFLPESSGIKPHTLYFNGSKKSLLRIPYFWEDDVEMVCPHKSWEFSDPKYHVNGLKVFDFHPAYIYLNSDTMAGYEELKTKGPLASHEEKNVLPFINRTLRGTGDFFGSFVEYLEKTQKVSYLISEVAIEWKKKQNF